MYRPPHTTKTPVRIGTGVFLNRRFYMHDRTSHKSKPAINALPDWSKRFFDPIPIQGGKPLFSLRDAAQYVLALPKSEQQATAWQTAAELLKMVAERGGDPMSPRIAMMKALHRREPQAAMMPRRRRMKSYRIVR
jgi:hypothetical protein